ncbi:helix-turn-helix domain-containing protein [Pectinatus frisingensis]|uniref:helix-turn-helix domain-containing protein n=1 Tax=Pectinatus frisingensis TaxID=865 RepID=UPI0018C819E7|nr:helix-turn-helix transcriptional regulator [Pectinatus frisingensis]
MSLNKRVKEVRNHLKYSQKEFASKLGLTQAGVSWMEQAGKNISDQNIRLMCSLFNINEDWLRNGNGEMFSENDDSIFNTFAQKYNLSPAEQEAARYCLQLTSEQRQEVLNHIVGLADAIKSAQVIAPDFTHHAKLESNNSENDDIENDEEFKQRMDILKQEYRAEKREKTSEESTFSRKTKGKRA